MGLPEAFAFARNFAVMGRVRGPDPKGLKMRRHAFHQYRSGETTLSASGMLIPTNLYDTELAKHLSGDLCEGMCLILTVASVVVEPFLSPHTVERKCFSGSAWLISGVRIDVMTKKISEKIDKGIPWPEAQLLSLMDIPASAHCLRHLLNHLSAYQSLGGKLAGLWHLTLMILSILKIFYKLRTKQVIRSTCKFDSLVCKPENTII
ncbi:hypothetical protein K1719_041037 [Acacia pycnantha]|nr:hypothetical protein K1719_041037 [Acacia pycnantha]